MACTSVCGTLGAGGGVGVSGSQASRDLAETEARWLIVWQSYLESQKPNQGDADGGVHLSARQKRLMTQLQENASSLKFRSPDRVRLPLRGAVDNRRW